MTYHQPFFYIARLVLETCTPLSIATGRTDGMADNLIVRDANGLPAIPGSSLAGVLRHSYQRRYDVPETEKLFGSPKLTEKDQEKSAKDKEEQDQTDNPSFVHISWGCVHDRSDKPVEGLLNPKPEKEPRWNDELLKDARQENPIQRDQVKLNHRGVSNAKKQGKFDRTSLTTGHRFSVEISLWSEENDPRVWKNLLNLLQRPDFRLGGGTRRGLGKLKIVRCYEGQFDLQNEKQFNQFSELSQSLSKTTHLQKSEIKSDDQLPKITLELTPLDGYRFGGGIESLAKKGSKKADLMAVTEHCVKWENGRGKLTKYKQVVIPASSVKGALSHRVAYHYNALNGVFADQVLKEPEKAIEDIKQYVEENNEAVQALFGYVKDKPKNDETDKQKESAQVGCLIFDDVYLKRTETQEVQAVEYFHNSINRFTGGVREGALFSEEVVTDKQAFELNITVALPSDKKDIKLNKVWKALQLALNDLANGCLALGAGGGRGHGYFKGQWKAGRQWLASQISPDAVKQDLQYQQHPSNLTLSNGIKSKIRIKKKG